MQSLAHVLVRLSVNGEPDGHKPRRLEALLTKTAGGAVGVGPTFAHGVARANGRVLEDQSLHRTLHARFPQAIDEVEMLICLSPDDLPYVLLGEARHSKDC